MKCISITDESFFFAVCGKFVIIVSSLSVLYFPYFFGGTYHLATVILKLFPLHTFKSITKAESSCHEAIEMIEMKCVTTFNIFFLFHKIGLILSDLLIEIIKYLIIFYFIKTVFLFTLTIMIMFFLSISTHQLAHMAV